MLFKFPLPTLVSAVVNWDGRLSLGWHTFENSGLEGGFEFPTPPSPEAIHFCVLPSAGVSYCATGIVGSWVMMTLSVLMKEEGLEASGAFELRLGLSWAAPGVPAFTKSFDSSSKGANLPPLFGPARLARFFSRWERISWFLVWSEPFAAIYTRHNLWSHPGWRWNAKMFQHQRHHKQFSSFSSHIKYNCTIKVQQYHFQVSKFSKLASTRMTATLLRFCN